MTAKQFWFVICVVSALSLYIMSASFTVYHHDWVAAALCVWLASPVLLYVHAFIFERTPVMQGGRGTTALEIFNSVFSFRRQAWSFILGDLLILPAAFAAAAAWWAVNDRSVDSSLLWWWITSLLVGAAAGLGFHYGIDRPRYVRLGKVASLHSPTKLIHDYASYPALLGGLLFAFGPMLLGVRWNWSYDWYVYAVLVLVGLWLLLGVRDRNRAEKLVPCGHPGYSHRYETCVPN